MAKTDELVKITEEINRTPSQVAINWVRQQQLKAQIIPNLGARTIDQLKDNMSVLDFDLSPKITTRYC